MSTTIVDLASSPSGLQVISIGSDSHSITMQGFRTKPTNTDNVREDIGNALDAIGVKLGVPFDADSAKVAEVQDAIYAVQKGWRANLGK